jgi:imidazolonepropionase
MTTRKLIGPFTQAVTMRQLPLKGPLQDEHMEIIGQAGILVNGNIIEAIGPYADLKSQANAYEFIEGDCVVMPGMVDAHTHICWAGSRAGDYAMRLSGKTYLDIAAQGGGIRSTVAHTRNAIETDLTDLTATRANTLLKRGVTSVEVKSGYGLNVEHEVKMLRAIRQAGEKTAADLVTTCLAAHIKPADYNGNGREYLEYIIKDLFPIITSQDLTHRIDMYVDEGAFTGDDARYYLAKARLAGFDVVVHADQFARGGVAVAVEAGARSADHLEASEEEDIRMLAGSNVCPVVLPGASMGLGMNFAPARRLLDAGCSLAIASDWNPGSAPMGNLLMQAAVLGAHEKLTMTETLAGITFRAAAALGLHDRGRLQSGMLADLAAFPCSDYREILYYQGSLTPDRIWKRGTLL